MPRLIPPIAVLAALLVRAASVHAQQDSVPIQTPPPLSLLDVRLACINPDSTKDPAASREMREICRLPLSRDSLRSPAVLQRWASAAGRPGLRALIRTRTDYLPTELKLADVINNLEESVRTRILTTLYKDVRFQQVTHDLGPVKLAELYHAATDSIEPNPTGSPAQQLASTLRTLMVPSDSSAAANQPIATLGDDVVGSRMYKEVVNRLESPQLALLLSRVPPLQKQVVAALTDSQSVEQILTQRDSTGEVIRTILNRAADETFTPTTSARERTSLSRQSDLLWATTDLVVDKVQQQLQIYAVQGFTTRLCRDVGATVLHESCAMLRSESFGFTQPGVTLLRSAVRQDLQALPSSMLEWTYGHYGFGRPWADQALTALQVTHLALNTARGDDPWLALAEVADRMRGMRDNLGASEGLAHLRADSLSKQGLLSAAEAAVRRLAANDPQLARTRARADSLRAAVADVNTRFEAAKSRVRGLALGPATPVSQLLLSVGELASTRFDALRLRNVVPADLRPEELLRYQLIALMANQQERRAVDGGLPFQPERLVPLALAVSDEIQRLKRVRARVDSVAAAHGDSVNVAALRLELAQSAFSTVDALFSQASQLPEFRDAAGFSRLGAAQQTVVAVREVVVPVLNGEYGSGLLALRRQVTPYFDKDSLTFQAWTRGMVFVSDLVNANSSEQINTALRRFADTGGGAQAKRNSEGVRVSLNAYGGAFGGPNWGITGERAAGRDAPFAGFYLPVGLSVVPGNTLTPRGIRRAGRFGLFVQAVDLGALASWRLKNTDTDTTALEERPQVGFAQVISPGVFLTFDLRTLPLTFGYGWAVSPQLREQTQLAPAEGDQARTVPAANATRGGFFIAFDIPLFP